MLNQLDYGAAGFADSKFSFPDIANLGQNVESVDAAGCCVSWIRRLHFVLTRCHKRSVPMC